MYIFSRVVPLYSHETKPNLGLLISFLHCDHFYNWLYNLDLICCTFIADIKRQQHCCAVENGITATRSGPDFARRFCSQKPRLYECNRPRKNPFKLIES